MNASVRSIPLLILIAAGLASAPVTRGQTSVSTNPVGYVQLNCSGTGDTTVSVPFTQPAAYVGLVASVSGSTITVSGTTGWSANQFVYSGSGTPTYYAQFGPNSSGTDPLDGLNFTIAANGTNTITISLNGATIDGSQGGAQVSVGSSVSIVPYWTLNTLFPPSASGTSFYPSTGTLARQRGTEILFPDYVSTGINLAPPASSTFYFYNYWRLAGDSSGAYYGDTPISPTGYVIVRNPASAGTTLTTLGNVAMGNVSTYLATSSSTAQDNAVSIMRPVSTSLSNLGLIVNSGTSPSSPFQASTGFLARQRSDQLMVSGTTPGLTSQSASAVYYFYNGNWYLAGDTTNTIQNSTMLPVGVGLTIRKVQTSNGSSIFWQNPQAY